MIPPLRSLVLAGGASSRMGTEKAGLNFHGEPQVRYLARMLDQITGGALVSIRPGQSDNALFDGLETVVDRHEGIGPLAGLLAAFAAAPLAAWLAVAVDMPYLTAETVRRLVRGRDPSSFATAYQSPETRLPEPVCAIYEPRIFPILLEAQRRGRHSLMLLRDLNVTLLEPGSARELFNVNEPDALRMVMGGTS